MNNTPWPPPLHDARTRTVQARSNGADYHIHIWTPPGTPPATGWPAIYVLDGNALFGTFVESIRRSSRRPDATGIAPAAVVAIAQDANSLYAPEALRRRDFTPARTPAQTTPRTPPAPDGDGRAAAFLSFLVDELAPALEPEFKLDPTRRSLFGHSLAGFFALHALSEHPNAFHSFAAISPSIWWDETGLRSRLTALPASGARAFIAVGEWEDEVPPWQRNEPGYEELVKRRAECRMIDNAREIADALRARLNDTNVAFHLFPDEDHASILMIASQRFLRFALAPASA